MSSLGLTILVTAANEHSERAAEAIESGQFEAAQAEMKALAEKYRAFCADQAKDAVDALKEDEQVQESTDEKGCVDDKPHSEHCVQS